MDIKEKKVVDSAVVACARAVAYVDALRLLLPPEWEQARILAGAAATALSDCRETINAIVNGEQGAHND